ncbi:hypothetical protein SDC9_139088 [bioreactor metagenome]|uniref:Uncharacterized protein n=1 Tax=bioreactor metagenome TaxID=1076179 RepID=A0A645DR60_9ZZZZ
MKGFAFVDKNSGNVDFIISWANVEILPENYPVGENQVVITIDNYNNDPQNYEAYDLENKVFLKKLTISTDKVRTLLGATVNVQIAYPDNTVNEMVHVTIGAVSKDVFVVNGNVTFSYNAQEIGILQVTATSSSIYGKNYANLEVLN